MTDQLDLFVPAEARAFPTQVSAAKVIARTAARLGYDYVAFCAHCSGIVVLVGEWRRDGWFHRDHGSVWCSAADQQRHAFMAALR